jgi:F-type H+-transporting ATPase subunit gamma
MASIKDLKKRIVTVKNTQQTTRAMKMVSAAKLRRAQEAIQSQRPYARRLLDLVKQVAAVSDSPSESPLVVGVRLPSSETESSGKTVLLVLVTSDRGLCGAFNGSIIKASQRWMKSEGTKYASVEMGFVGKRGHDFFKTKNVKVRKYFEEVGGKVTFAKARELTRELVDIFLTGGVQEVKFVYNEFKNAVSQKVVIEDFLPLGDLSNASRGSENPAGGKGGTSREEPAYLIKPSSAEVLDQLLAKNFAIQSFRILLESQASEHGARMSAMENATKNAGEMIRKLTLQFNKQRQAGITKELLEIISGSESQRASG